MTTAQLLESLGHEVVESFPESLFDPDFGPREQPLWRIGASQTLRNLSKMLGRPATREDVEPQFWLGMADANLPPVTVEEEWDALEWVNDWIRRVARWWANGFDLLLTPTVWEPPATLASMTPVEGKPWKLGRKVAAHVLFTRPFNVTGQPAISLPLHWTPEGLPVGVQLVAAMGREDLLIRIASQIEQAQPWIDRLPPVRA
jgi:amidase